MSAKGKMLALEISPKVVRAMEYVPGTSPLEVTLSAATDWPGGEPVRVGRFLREFLSSRGFTARRAVVSYFGPLIEHRIYVLPPTTGETRDALLRGKVAEEISTPVSELKVTGEIIGKQVERGVDRHEVLAVYIPEFEIRQSSGCREERNSGSPGSSPRISRRPGVPLPQSPSTISWTFRRQRPRRGLPNSPKRRRLRNGS